MGLSDSVFVKTCRGEPAAHVPVWFMRQAGRSLPEYRVLREKHSMLDMTLDPELTVEATMQPVRRYGVDAAILFSDIMTPLLAAGIDIDIKEGVGPVVAEPFGSSSDLVRLSEISPERLDHVSKAVRALVEVLPVPLIGFAGAPFTLASYLIEGGPSKTYSRVKSAMVGDPEFFSSLLDRLADVAIVTLTEQVRNGASAVQLFDSWAGQLERTMYEKLVMPHSAKVFAALRPLGVPLLHFGVGTGEILDLMGAAGADVVGVDWRVPLDRAKARIPGYAVQGNLDPSLLKAPAKAIEAATLDVLRRGGGIGHVFNLGHGVQPDTDPAALAMVVEIVHSFVADAHEIEP